MPAHLPPLSRREFIVRTLAFSAAMGISPGLLAASKDIDVDSWAFFADTHIAGDTNQEARGINMAKHFREISKDVLSLPKRPAAIMVAGDCALSSGQEGDYATFKELLVPLRGMGLPLHLLLGNHDHRERFWAAFPKARKADTPERHATVLKTRHANLFLLDSLEETNSTPGLLGTGQLEWLERELDARKTKPAIVVAHHNPGYEPATGALKDTQELLKVLRPRKQVKAYVYGHTHRWEIAQDPSGIHLVNLPTTAYVFKEDEPSGWVLAKLNKRSMSLQLRCVDPAHKLNGQKVELKWRAHSA